MGTICLKTRSQLSQFMRGDRLPLADDQLAVIVNKASQNERSNVELWASMYVCWLLLGLAKAEYGEEFAGRRWLLCTDG
jgi:hypothetical protein